MPTYDPTVAIIAGDIVKSRIALNTTARHAPETIRWAVEYARAIVAETIRTEPKRSSEICWMCRVGTERDEKGMCVYCGAGPETGEPR